MTERLDTLSRMMPSATPSDSDLAAWQTLPRDEQLRRLQTALSHDDCADASSASMSDILRRAQPAAKSRHG